ncbi:MAG TPA: DUF5606 domain-containing protein [Cryomorphaceae bacterium]|nr:DUF5606 domain-containing protein [Cryomorphaceae bacterium]
MDLSQILSITGKPGLYKILNQSRGGVVVISLNDGKKMVVGQTQRVSTLSDISIYTLEGDEPLAKIFEKMKEQSGGKEVEVDSKDPDALREYFFRIFPEHDEDRVYPSDIKKMIKWFNLLLEKGLLESTEEEKEEEAKAEKKVEVQEEAPKAEETEEAAEAKAEKKQPKAKSSKKAKEE